MKTVVKDIVKIHEKKKMQKNISHVTATIFRDLVAKNFLWSMLNAKETQKIKHISLV